ncbi:MAG TPA: gluconate 2-dehydrogenase subunit 3 family protein [Roseiflexaceae bacterium]|nr:gluconate 2-dehydrogenase subunit 3 family protein [Roseiflexaceae bacterium]
MFTERQLATLRALIDRIIPPDDFPSGWEAGVGDYLEGQFERDLRPQLDRYRAGLDALDAEARAAAGAGFAELGAAEQDALLSQVEAGQVTVRWPIDPAAFFSAAVEHAMEGFYSDPGNGGNRDGVSWRMIGFEVRA